ncbi:MAG: EscU/YscU/HrcU family type III secretion system export apparatus switch protein [Myxococcota bacterium]
MAEQDKSSKTEEASAKRKAKLREEGKIAKSADIGAAVVLITGCICIALLGDSLWLGLHGFSTRMFRFEFVDNPALALASAMSVLQRTLLPFVILTMLAAVISGILQTRWFFSFKPLMPKPERFNPIPQLKKILPGKESAIELLKQMTKLLLLGAVVFRLVAEATPAFAMLAATQPITGASMVLSVAGQVAIQGSIAFALIAAFDWWYNRKKFADDNKMSKQEVKDEHKEAEGDPHLRGKRRRKQREAANRRAVADVEKATCLVTNPTHISIALRYESGGDTAPIVIAKGVDNVAMKMREKARKRGIPILENKPVARAMYRDVKVGQPIPVELYESVAAIIAHVLRLKGQI